jgi:hypothetical protein
MRALMSGVRICKPILLAASSFRKRRLSSAEEPPSGADGSENVRHYKELLSKVVAARSDV